MRRTVVDGVEQVVPLLGLADVGINEQRVCLGVHVLHHDLEAVEAAGLGDLHLAAKALDQVFVDDAVRRGEEGKDMRNKEALVVVKALVPVVQVLGQVDLLGRPERRLGLLVHLPDLCDASCQPMRPRRVE